MWTDKINKKVHLLYLSCINYDLYHEIVGFDRIKVEEYLKVSCGFVLYQLLP